MENIFGIPTIPTFEINRNFADAIDAAAFGRQLANCIPDQCSMQDAYGHFYRAYQSLVQQMFGDDLMPSGELIHEWIMRNSASWDSMGNMSDIKYYLADEMAFCLIIVES